MPIAFGSTALEAGAGAEAVRFSAHAVAPLAAEHRQQPQLPLLPGRGHAKSLSPTKACREKKKRPSQLVGLGPGARPELPNRFVANVEQWKGGAKPRVSVGGSGGSHDGSSITAGARTCVDNEIFGSQDNTSPRSCCGPPLLDQLRLEDALTSASSSPECLQVEGLDELQALGHLGQGASGRVEKHRHLRTGKELALKMIPARDIAEPQLKAIIIELKTFAKCRNAHIVNFYGAYLHDNSIHIALEYMDAGALSTVLERARVIPERLLANISWQVLDGFEYLHTQMHVVHRDVKPSNLLLSRSGIVKITDFGVSGELEDDVASRCAVTFVGTMYYMSPERVRGEPYKYDSDLWSFGVTLLECLMGQYPYVTSDEGSMKQLSFWELMRRIVEQDAPSLPPDSEHSEELRDFLGLTLQKEPCQRSSAAVLKTHAWIQGPPSPAQQVELASWVCGCVGDPYDGSTCSTATQANAPPLQTLSSLSRRRGAREAPGASFFGPLAAADASVLTDRPRRASAPAMLSTTSPTPWPDASPVASDSLTSGGMDQAIKGGGFNPFLVPPPAPSSPATASNTVSDEGCPFSGFAAFAAAADAADAVLAVEAPHADDDSRRPE